MTKQEKISLLIENYKLIADESKTYLNEIIKCFIYFAVVLAYRFGYDKKDFQGPRDYMNWAFLCIIIYLLTIGFMYINANRYKAQIESKINKLAGEKLFEFELIYKPTLLKSGFLPLNGKEDRRILPLPNILIVFSLLIICFSIFINNKLENLKEHHFVFLTISIFVIALLFIYVFLLIPRQIEKFQKTKNWIK